MKTFKLSTLIIATGFLLSSCAATYNRINPPSLNYGAHDIQEGISYSYKYDVLREKGNNKYADKEEKADMKLVAIKLTNNSNRVLNVSRDLVFYSNNSQVIPMNPTEINNTLKQNTGGYYAYLLLTLLNLQIKTDAKTSNYPVGLAIGPGVTFLNVSKANKANKNLMSELYDYNILNRDLQKGETVYGIFGIRGVGHGAITVRLSDAFRSRYENRKTEKTEEPSVSASYLPETYETVAKTNSAPDDDKVFMNGDWQITVHPPFPHDIKSIEDEHVQVCIGMALQHSLEKSDESIKYYIKSAEKGNADAMAILALIYAKTDALKDSEKALFWYKRAKSAGHKSAQTNYDDFVATNQVSLSRTYKFSYSKLY